MFRLHFMANFVKTRKNFPDAQKLSGRQCRRADEVFGTLEFTPKLLHFHKSAWSPKMFTPTFQYFYTDISAISVTYWIFVHISCHSLHHSNVYVLRGITAFSLLCFAHDPGKMAISLMPYLD